ncbi:MAG: hypothetical protein V3W34_03990 [Phycisphaerae bacterium]
MVTSDSPPEAGFSRASDSTEHGIESHILTGEYHKPGSSRLGHKKHEKYADHQLKLVANTGRLKPTPDPPSRFSRMNQNKAPVRFQSSETTPGLGLLLLYLTPGKQAATPSLSHADGT